MIPQIYINKELTGSNRFSPFLLGLENEQYMVGANRIPNPETMTIGMLEKIDLPEGGHYSYIYEPDQFTLDYCPGTTFTGGGVRLKQLIITPDNNPDNEQKTSYYYADESDESTGKLIALPVFGFLDPTNSCDYNYDMPYSSWDYEVFNYFYVRTPYNMNEFSDGVIGYDRVTEEAIGNGSTGKTEYVFFNEATHNRYDNTSYPFYTYTTTDITPSLEDILYYPNQVPPDTIPYSTLNLDFGPVSYPYPPNTNYSWYRGSIKEINQYNGDGQIVASVSNDYDFFYANGEGPDILYGLKIGFFDNNSPPDDYECQLYPDYLLGPLTVSSKYEIHTNIKALYMSSHYLTYDENNASLDQSTNMTYNAYGQIAERKDINSDGSELITRYKYPLDYWDINNPPVENIETITDPYSKAIAFMAVNHMYEYPVETLSLIRKAENEPLEVTGGSLMLYTINVVNDGDVPLPCHSLSIFTTEPIDYSTSFTDSYIDSENDFDFVFDEHYQVISTIDGYDAKGHILQFHSSDNPVISRLWNSDDSKIIAEAFNACHRKTGSDWNEDIGFTGFELNDPGEWSLFGQNAELSESSDAKSGAWLLETSNHSGVYKHFTPGEGLENQNGYQATVWVKGPAQAYLKISINNDPDTYVSAYSSDVDVWNLLTVKLYMTT